MGEIITIYNKKGGVGKTTTAINLSAGLVRHGYKVLAVDADSQGSLTDSLGVADKDHLEFTLMEMISAGCESMTSSTETLDRGKYIVQTEEGIDLIPANRKLGGAQVLLNSQIGGATMFRYLLTPLRDQYDYIIIDGCATFNILVTNAMTCADSVIIPVETQYLAAKGMRDLLDDFLITKRTSNPALILRGILLTKTDDRTRATKDTRAMIRNTFGHDLNVFQTEIPSNTQLAAAPQYGRSIFSYAKWSTGAKAYEQLVEEILTY